MNLNHLPLVNEQEDVLGFNSRADEIASYINNFSYNVPCAISISGEWGTGKSTLMNFVQTRINKDKCDVIKFNPWAFSDRDQILHSLFEEIYDCIDQGFTNAKNKFLEYAQKLSKPVSKVAAYLTQTVHGVPHQIANVTSDAASELVGQVSKTLFDKPLSKRRKEVEEELDIMFTGNKKKIVVFIDEIDRMFPDEVIQIFQAIKSILDLPGLMFVVAMDNDSIIDSLSKAGISKPKDYLQKIFQHNFEVVSKYQLSTLCTKILLPQFEGTEHYNDLVNLIDTFVYIGTPHYRDDSQEIRKHFNNLKTELRKTFENPRKFIKLTNYFIIYWGSYLKSIEELISNQDLNRNTAFLLFLAKFELGEEMDINFLNSKSDSNLLITIAHLLKLIYPSGDLKKDISVVRKMMLKLSTYPDFILKPPKDE